MSNLMYREDHTTDCWINLLRLPIITIVTSSLYNYIISLCNKAWNIGLRIEKLAKCRYMIPMLRFRYFHVLLLPGFYSIVFSWCFYFYLKKVKIILTLGRTRGCTRSRKQPNFCSVIYSVKSSKLTGLPDDQSDRSVYHLHLQCED